MKTLCSLLLTALVGCTTSQPHTGRPIHWMAEGEMGGADPGETLEQSPPPPAHGKRPGRGREHPRGRISIESGPGTFEYKTRGTVNNANTDAHAVYTRFTYNARYFGLQLSGIDTDSELRANVRADTFDAFVYANLPLWPNRRLRFYARPGGYFTDINLKNTVPEDVEPQVWGFRYELEGEFDIIQKPRLVLSIYGSGRFEFGSGDARVNGLTESIDGFGWGWEAGVRLHWRRLFGGIGWVSREQEFDGTRRFLSADYSFQGGVAFIGFRW